MAEQRHCTFLSSEVANNSFVDVLFTKLTAKYIQREPIGYFILWYSSLQGCLQGSLAAYDNKLAIIGSIHKRVRSSYKAESTPYVTCSIPGTEITKASTTLEFLLCRLRLRPLIHELNNLVLPLICLVRQCGLEVLPYSPS